MRLSRFDLAAFGRAIVRFAVVGPLLGGLAMAVDVAWATPVDLAPNPNPPGNIITAVGADTVNTVSFVNQGLINISAALVPGTLTNTGSSAVLLNQGPGTIAVGGAGATLVNTLGATLANERALTVGEGGILRNLAGGLITNNDFFSSAGSIFNSGAGTMLVNQGGGVLNLGPPSGGLSNALGASLVNTGSGTTLVIGSALANELSATLTNQNLALVRNFGTLTNRTGAFLTNTNAALVNESGATLNKSVPR